MTGDAGGGSRRWRVGSMTPPVRALMAVVALFVVLSGAVLGLTPPWEANDEPDHVNNIVILRSGSWYRIPDENPVYLRESHQPPLYYLLLTPWHAARGLEEQLAKPENMPGFPQNGLGHWQHDLPTEARDERIARWMRLPSIAMGAGVVVLAFLTARRFTTSSWTPVLAAAIVATFPRFVFLAGTVNNDNLANLLGALLTYLAVRLVTDPPRRQRDSGSMWPGLAYWRGPCC